MTAALLKRTAWFAALAIPCLAFSVSAWRFLTAPEDSLLQVIPDDAFYYLQIARNLTRLGESTADGISTTNGYHPLWMVFSVVLAWLFPQNTDLMRAAAATSLALHVCVAVGLRYSLLPLIGKEWSWTAAACWLVNPLSYLIAQQAVEATVYALALLAVFVFHRRIGEFSREVGAPLSLTALYGVSLGVLCLARTEGFVIAAIGLVWVAVGFIGGAGIAHSLRRVFTAAGSCLVVVLPWFVFSWLQTGTIVQDSGAMKVLWASDSLPGLAGVFRNLIDTADFFARRCIGLMTGTSGSTIEVLLFSAVIAISVVIITVRDPHGRYAGALWTIAVPVLSIWLTSGIGLSERQIWWLVLPCLALLMATFIILRAFVELMPVRPEVEKWIQGTVVVASLIVFLGWHRNALPPYPWQPDVRRSQLAFEGVVPASARIGCFNAGIPMFFGSTRVVALDGLVNHRVRTHWEDRTLDDFLRAESIRYIADEQRAMNRALRFVRGRPTLERLQSFPLRGWPTGERLLWRVTWPHGAGLD